MALCAMGSVGFRDRAIFRDLFCLTPDRQHEFSLTRVVHTGHAECVMHVQRFHPRSSLNAMTSGRIILSVDDEAGVLYSRQKILQAAGYDVLSASDGEQALDFLASAPVDLVVLDYSMPGINGEEVARKIKADRPDIPIILVSGLLMEAEALSCIDSFFTKGEGPTSLLEKIGQLLRPALPL
jgi:CheY-like chemotaxis protein